MTLTVQELEGLTLEEKLAAVDRQMKETIADFNKKHGRTFDAPVGPSMAVP